MKQLIRILLLLWCLALCTGVNVSAKDGPRTVVGLVTGVVDGDTLYLMIDGKSVRARLAQIDAPERGQAYGRRAEQALREMVWKREVTATWRENDRNGRPIVQIIEGSVDVNAAMVERGMAWVYTQYSRDPKLRALEKEARQAKRGLWADANPVAP